MQNYLDFEKSVAELEGKIEELTHLSESDQGDIQEQIGKLRTEVDRLLRRLYARLTPWQKLQVARHPERPHCLDYIRHAVTDFVELAGDRRFGEDQALVAGLGRLRGRSVAVIGHEKGSDTESRIKHNFGMAKPEGYRKAQRIMRLAERFSLPVITLIDTAGAYPGVAAENRGQAEAIAASIDTTLDLRVPVVASVIGEGGSGGAIAVGAGDRVLMQEHAVYSVISPEGCASILWRSGSYSQEAAAALKLTAQDLKHYGVVDTIIDEPVGGAHREPETAIERWAETCAGALDEIVGRGGGELRASRREKFLTMTTQVPE